MRIMGLDFGSKTVGVAISDPLLITAQGIEIIRRKEENKLRQTLARIEELILEYEVEEIVLGYPKHMNDSEGDRVALTKEFAEKLMRRTALPITFWDERLTTVAADRTMIEAGIRREDRKEHVDRIAAVLILQGYLEDRMAFWSRKSLSRMRMPEKQKSGWKPGCKREESRKVILEKIEFCPDGGEKVEFYVLEQTRLGGCDYILVTDSMDSEEEEGEALILKDISAPEDKEAIYEIVEDERELDAVAEIFSDMLEDIDLEK